MHTLALIFAIPVLIALSILQIKNALPDFAAVAIIALIMTLYYAF